MTLVLRAMAVSLIAIVPATAQASDVERLAGLSKKKFIAEYESLLMQMMAAQQELFLRFDPTLATSSLDTGPVTDEERVAVSCMWDTMNKQGQLEGLAQQALMGQAMVRLTEERPDVDIVDFFMNDEILGTMAQDTPDGIIDAMQECGSIKASSHRVKFNEEVWAAIGAAAEARGYTN